MILNMCEKNGHSRALMPHNPDGLVSQLEDPKYLNKGLEYAFSAFKSCALRIFFKHYVIRSSRVGAFTHPERLPKSWSFFFASI